MAEVVPTPERTLPANGHLGEHSKELDKFVRMSGMEVQEVLADPEDPSKAVILLPEGLPPCIHEKNQTGDEDWARLQRILEVTGNQRLASRLELLKT